MLGNPPAGHKFLRAALPQADAAQGAFAAARGAPMASAGCASAALRVTFRICGTLTARARAAFWLPLAPQSGERVAGRMTSAKPGEGHQSHALLKALRLQTQYPDAEVALAFPDFPRYRAFYADTQLGLAKLGLRLFLVKEDGEVEASVARMER